MNRKRLTSKRGERGESHPNPNPSLIPLLLVPFLTAMAEIKILQITSDSRPMILFEKFGFTHVGHVSILISTVSISQSSDSMTGLNPLRIGFLLLSDDALLESVDDDVHEMVDVNEGQKGEKVDDVVYDGLPQSASDNGMENVLEKGEKVGLFQLPFRIGTSLVNKTLNALRDVRKRMKIVRKMNRPRMKELRFSMMKERKRLPIPRYRMRELTKNDQGEDWMQFLRPMTKAIKLLSKNRSSRLSLRKTRNLSWRV
ncbi:hypothetical protein Droror1_Dr00014586 [Drosera rotundifolia]